MAENSTPHRGGLNDAHNPHDAGVTPDAAGAELLCVTCGYALRGLDHDGMCPECGTPIERSLRGDLLAGAAPAWLATVTRGATLIALGLRIAVVCVLATLGLTITFVFISMARPGLPSIVETIFTCIIAGAVIGLPVAGCVCAIGVFLLTAREGRDLERESPWSSRNVGRWSMVGLVATAATVAALHTWPVAGTLVAVADVVMRVVFVGCATIAALAVTSRLVSLARRVPENGLAMKLGRSYQFLRWAVPAAGLYLIVMPAFAGGAFGGGMTMGSILTGIVGCVGFIAVIGLVLMAARLSTIVRTCAAQFRDCLTQARLASAATTQDEVVPP